MVRKNLLDQLESLKEEIGDLKEQISELYAQSINNERIIARLEVNIEAKNEEIIRLNKKIEKLNREINGQANSK